jgi:hypothetical protein
LAKGFNAKVAFVLPVSLLNDLTSSVISFSAFAKVSFVARASWGPRIFSLSLNWVMAAFLSSWQAPIAMLIRTSNPWLIL